MRRQVLHTGFTQLWDSGQTDSDMTSVLAAFMLPVTCFQRKGTASMHATTLPLPGDMLLALLH